MQINVPRWRSKREKTAGGSLISASEKFGLPPGALVHVGEVHHAHARITLARYDRDEFVSSEIESLDQLESSLADEGVYWINVDGLNDVTVVEYLGRLFQIHPLIQEDILNTHQRPKLIEHEDYLYLVCKAINVDEGLDPAFTYEQISILLLSNCVLTFKEKSDNRFSAIYKRLQKKHSRFRENGADYLAYALLDIIVDDFFRVEDCLEESILVIEDQLLETSAKNALKAAHQLRRELITIRKVIAPLRDLIGRIRQAENNLVEEKTLHYFDDVYDHVLRVLDAVESHREQIVVMQDIYLNSLSNKMNETIQVLTVFATIFIPLTFITGIYGMNFRDMPELTWPWAYPALWLLFVLITAALLVYFKKKKWL